MSLNQNLLHKDTNVLLYTMHRIKIYDDNAL